MKSKNKINSASQQTFNSKQNWNDDLKQQLQKIKRPFLNRVEYSKLQIQSKIKNFNNEKSAEAKQERSIQSLTQKLLNKQHLSFKQQMRLSQQSEELSSKQQLHNQKSNNFELQDDSDEQKQNQTQAASHLAQWQGRDKQRIFKNSSIMADQFDKVFNKKIGLSQTKKKALYSYRKEQKQMLDKIFTEIKNPTQNNVVFQKIYNFFQDCRLFYTVYGINPGQLQDLVSCSAHKYPNKLTREEFLELFLINSQTRNFDELESKVKKTCCLEQQNWTELKQLFTQLDTFGNGTVRTGEFFHKMKTVSPSKQLLEAKAIYFTSVNRYYSFSKVLFELENKKTLPQKICWSELQLQIINFSHIDYPTMDDIFQKQIKSAIIQKDTNSFLLKQDTLTLLKDEFLRCPKFSQHFVKCKYFCEELFSTKNLHGRMSQCVRNNHKSKGFITLQANIRLLQAQGPQYIDLDQMLTYFSVKGFQHETYLNNIKDSFDTNSTASDEEFEEKKRQISRAKRMKSLDQMNKIMKNVLQNKFQTQNKKTSFKPVKVQEFNLTKRRDHLTIRQQKVKQMIEEKQRKQEQEIRPFVPASPIPASINCQRYLDQKSKQQTKREIQRERRLKKYQKDQQHLSYLQSNTKLFKGSDTLVLEQQQRKYLSPQSKKQFEAKPISWFIKERNLLEIIQGEKQQRRKNRCRQTNQKYVYGYWKNMPYQNDSGFKKSTNTQSMDQIKSDESIDVNIRLINEEHERDLQKPKTTVVPDFAKLQKEFMEQLQSKKKMKNPTIVKEFNLSVSKKKPQIVQDQTIKKLQTPKKTHIHKNDSPIIVGTTKKYQNMVELTQLKIAQKIHQAELKLIEEKQRKNKQKVFAKFMSKALRQENNKLRSQSSQRTTRQNHSKQNSSMIQQENQLRKIYEKVLNRPFLFQTACSQSEGLTKRGIKNEKNSKKNRKQVPKKIKIPGDTPISIPPLHYIEEQEYPVDYQNERNNEDDEYIVREFENESHFQEEQSFADNVYANRNSNQARGSLIQQLNQSF